MSSRKSDSSKPSSVRRIIKPGKKEELQPIEGRPVISRPLPTPSKAPTKPQITKGAASVVFFYFGDSKYTTLAQETVRLKLAMEDYNQIVLLKHNVIPNFFDLSSKDEKLANVVATPTKQKKSGPSSHRTGPGWLHDRPVHLLAWFD